MEIKRTPDEAFQDLPGYDFDPNYVEIPDFEGSLRWTGVTTAKILLSIS